MTSGGKAGRRPRQSCRREVTPNSRPDCIDEDLRTAAMLEGRPFPQAKAVAAALGISHAAAFRLLSRMKRKGILRMVSVPQLRDDVCECVAFLEPDLADAAAANALVEHVRLDPAVISAARLSGRFELRLEAIHADFPSANGWFKDLANRRGVVRARLCFTKTLFRRWTFAAAILGEACPKKGEADARL